MTVVYLDSVFLFNALLDYLLVLSAARLAGLTLRRGRYILCGLLGGAYAAAVFLPGGAFLTAAPVKAAAGVLLALVIKTFATGARSEDLLGSYICAGIGGALLAQIAVNVGMNLRVLPVIGVTLPFYSAGGSSVLMLYICVGLVLSVYTHNTKKLFG